MKVIYKYVLKHLSRQIIEIPIGHEIISIDIQRGVPCIWIMEDPDEKNTQYFTVELFCAGEKFEDSKDRYSIGTYFLPNGLVFHVFLNTNNDMSEVEEFINNKTE